MPCAATPCPAASWLASASDNEVPFGASARLGRWAPHSILEFADRASRTARDPRSAPPRRPASP